MSDLYEIVDELTKLSKSIEDNSKIRKLIAYYEDKIFSLEKEYEEEFCNDVFV